MNPPDPTPTPETDRLIASFPSELEGTFEHELARKCRTLERRALAAESKLTTPQQHAEAMAEALESPIYNDHTKWCRCTRCSALTSYRSAHPKPEKV